MADDGVTGEEERKESPKLEDQIDDQINEISNRLDEINMEHLEAGSEVASLEDDDVKDGEKVESKFDRERSGDSDNFKDFGTSEGDKTDTSLEGEPNVIGSEITTTCDEDCVGDDIDSCKLDQPSQKYLDNDSEQDTVVNDLSSQDVPDTDSSTVIENDSHGEKMPEQQSGAIEQSTADSSFEGAQII